VGFWRGEGLIKKTSLTFEREKERHKGRETWGLQDGGEYKKGTKWGRSCKSSMECSKRKRIPQTGVRRQEREKAGQGPGNGKEKTMKGKRWQENSRNVRKPMRGQNDQDARKQGRCHRSSLESGLWNGKSFL